MNLTLILTVMVTLVSSAPVRLVMELTMHVLSSLPNYLGTVNMEIWKSYIKTDNCQT